MDRTWCLCGWKTYPGDRTTRTHLACCDGALTEINLEYVEWDQQIQESP